jgi:hypothetical protein
MQEPNSIANTLVRAFQSEALEKKTYEEYLRTVLTSFSMPQQVAFAASVAEQCYPLYESFVRRSGTMDPQAVRSTLDRIWQHVAGVRMDESAIESHASALEAHKLDNSKPQGLGAAFHALSSVYSSLMACGENTVEHCITAALCLSEAVEKAILEREMGLFYAFPSPEETRQLFSRIAHDPLIVAELRRQAEVLEFLQDHPVLSDDDVAVLRQI